MASMSNFENGSMFATHDFPRLRFGASEFALCDSLLKSAPPFPHGGYELVDRSKWWQIKRIRSFDRSRAFGSGRVPPRAGQPFFAGKSREPQDAARFTVPTTDP